MDELMSMKLTTLAIFATLFSTNLFAANYIAKVTKLRGSVTTLIPGAHKATTTKLGDQLLEDTSLVTRKNSFIRIEFYDGSRASLGPNGKLVVSKMNKSGKGILTLLKGQLRSKINNTKAKTKSHKFLIKTRSAALGVRGTEFQTIYNPENNITNLLTYKGEVAIAKVEPKKNDYENKINKISKQQVSEAKKIKLKRDLNIEMEKALSSKKAVVVKRGQFSGTVDSVEKASLPVNISPVQLNALYSNTELAQAKKSNVKLSKLDNVDNTKNFIKPVPQEVSPEGVYNPESGDFAQKSGGFIDVKTGLYIPPEKSSTFSQTKNIYIAQKVGNFDVQTGEYFPPKGLELNATKGFVVADSSKMTSNYKSKKAKQAEIMNNIIDKKVVLKKKPKKKSVRYLNQLELFSKNAVGVKLEGFGQTIKHYDSPQAATRDIKSDGQGFIITWDHSSGGKWQPITNFSYRSIKFKGEELNEFNQATSSLYGMELGVRRYINSRVNISSSIGLNQNFFTASTTDTNGTTFDLRKATVPSIDLLGQWFFVKSSRYDLDLRLGLLFSLDKTAKDVKYESGLGAKLGLGYRYWLKRNWWTRLDFNAKSSKHDIRGTNYSATNELITSALGIEIGYAL
jgi:hypothetical protein